MTERDKLEGSEAMFIDKKPVQRGSEYVLMLIYLVVLGALLASFVAVTLHDFARAAGIVVD
jgi:hypothetical protein